MTNLLTRRSLLAAAPLGVLAAAVPNVLGAEDSPTGEPTMPGFPAQDPELVSQVVGLSHRDVEGVKKLVEKRPALAKAAWDWGFGDWETAIGAASHVGRVEIVEVLMAHGARPDIFTFAMLGNLEVVRAMIEASPGIQRTLGPHGITLLRHAEAGREKALPVLEYLRSLGDADPKPEGVALSEVDREACLGNYSFGPHETDTFEVTFRNNALFLGRKGQFPRALTHLGELAFFPAGAEAVRIRFERDSGGITAVVCQDDDLIVRGTRV